MKRIMEKLETLLEWGGLKKEIILLVISGISLLLSLFHIPLPFSIAWVAIILCGVPIILEAIIGLVTAFDIKADALFLWHWLHLSASGSILQPEKSHLSCSWGHC